MPPGLPERPDPESRQITPAAAAGAPAPAGLNPGGPPAPRRRRRWLRRSLLLLGPLVVAIAAAYAYYSGGRHVGTENAYVKADKVMIAAEVSGLIVDIAVRENEPVAAGEVLFRLDDRSYRIALSRAEADLAAVRDEIAGLKAEYAQRQAEQELAEADLAFAGKEFERQTRLVASNAASRSKYDAALHARDVARRRIAIAAQELAQMRTRLSGDPAIPVSRHPRYQAALAARDRAALDLERTAVRAPFAGIASHTPQIGQQVTGNGPLSSPVMSLVATDGIWIEANFKETDLTHVRPGQKVTIHVDSYPDLAWNGRVQSLSQATGAEFSVIPPQNATGNWVKVVQRIPVRIAVQTDGADPALRAGMSTAVEIDTGHRRPLPGILQTALAWLEGGTAAAAAAETAARQ